MISFPGQKWSGPFDAVQDGTYKTWKIIRDDFAKNLGQHFLTLSEAQVSTIFSEWEGGLHLRIQSDKPNSQLSCLLVISLLHYFRRSFDQLKIFYPTVKSLSSSMNREVCKAAAAVTRYIGKTSVDNQVFLRESLDLAKMWLSAAYRSTYSYNSLILLLKIIKFLPKEVLNITSYHIPEIWEMLISHDTESVNLAIKVMNNHLMQLEQQTAFTFGTSLFLDSIAEFEKRPIPNPTGILVIIRTLYKISPTAIKLNILIPQLLLIAKLNSSAITDILPLFMDIVKADHSQFDVTTYQAFIALSFSKFYEANCPKIFFDLFIEMLDVLPYDCIPSTNLMLDLKKVINNPTLVDNQAYAFDVIYKLVSLFPNVVLQASVFNAANPSVGLIRSLPGRESLIFDMKTKLFEWYERGIQKNATPQEVEIALVEVKTFGTSVFDPIETYLEQIQKLVFYQDTRIRLLLADTLSSIDSKLSFESLIRMAVYDCKKEVRILAIQKLSQNIEKIKTHSELLANLLADASYKVRRMAIPLIAKVYKLNPMKFYSTISAFTRDFLVANIHETDMRRLSRACSVLPAIAEHFTPLVPTMFNDIMWFCSILLLHGIPFPDKYGELHAAETDADKEKLNSKIAKLRSFTPLDMNDLIRSDQLNDNSIGFLRLDSFSEKDVILRQLYVNENERWSERRDSYLFQTLGHISNNIAPYVIQITPIFINTFMIKRDEEVYLSALEALTKIIVSFESALNIRSYFPDFLPALLKLLSGGCSDKVGIAILKLVGTIGPAGKGSSIDAENAPKDDNTTAIINYKSQNYFTRFTLDHLMELLKHPSPTLLRTITSIIVYDHDTTLSCLEPLMNAFVATFKISDNPAPLFNMLDNISYYCKAHILPYVDMFLPILKYHIHDVNCLSFVATMSDTISYEFTHFASILYPCAIKLATTRDLCYLKVLMRFVITAIVYQKQPADVFIDTIVQRTLMRKENDEAYIKVIAKTLCTLLQNRVLNLESARILNFAFSVTVSGKPDLIDELLVNLCMFGGIEAKEIIDYCSISDISFHAFDEYVSCIRDKKHYSVLVRKIKRNKPRNMEESIISEPTQNAFDHAPPPIYNNQSKWVDDLTNVFISDSPSPAIRGSYQVARQFRSFRNTLFPAAFLSCWLNATNEQKANFSQIIKLATETYTDLDSSIFELLNALNIVGSSLNIGDDILSAASQSTPLSLFYMQRHFRTHQDDKNVIERMLSLYTRMRMSESARGLLIRKSSTIGSAAAAKWSEQLGEYERALEIYDSTPNDENKNHLGQIRCYSALEQWETVRTFGKYFNEMPEADKSTAAINFAQAFYYSGDYEKAQYYVSFFKDNHDMDSTHFKSLFYIDTGKYEEAEKEINIGFNKLVENRQIYDGNDTNRATQNIEFAHQLVELKEALELRKNGIKKVPGIWQNRIDAFTEDSDMWITLIKTRLLVLSPADHIRACTKMLSVLRKERKWRAIDSYVQRLSIIESEPEFIINLLKVLWMKGERIKAVELMSYLGRSLSISSQQEFDSFIQSEDFKTHEPNVGFLKPFLDESNDYKGYVQYLKKHSIDDVMRARVARIATTWKYNMYKANTASATSLSDIINSFQRCNELNSNDYRTWAGWAYATSRALSHNEEKLAEYAIAAISGFIQATSLKPSGSLEYLCLMFSILFRYGEHIKLPQSLEDKIIMLPPQIVIQIIPQIVVHISHKDEGVRNIVRAIITAFSKDHFEAVVFALNVLSLLKDESKSKVANDLLNELGSEHTRTFLDAKLFITGMRSSAISICETLIVLINRAIIMHQSHNVKEYLGLVGEAINLTENPKCELDRILIHSVQNSVQRCVIPYNSALKGESRSSRALIDALVALFNELEERMKKLDSISLTKISEELASKRHFSLNIPGKYNVSKNGSLLNYIEPTLHVLNTAQHPRSTHLVDENGRRWKFLLKGNEDLRLDQRIMQFFSLLNMLLKTNRLTSGLGVTIEQYNIVPFAPDAGLVSWVTGADTLLQLVYDFRNERNISCTIEQDVMKDFTDVRFNNLSNLQRLEAYETVKRVSPANELRDSLWQRAQSPQQWIAHVRDYTVSTALMSIAGYVIGLGDRHPSNIMIQRHTGRVVHIDFGESFDSAALRKKFPEHVPFRMTRMIVNALDGESVEGLFRKSCEDVLWVLRENQSPIVAQLEIFVHEPIFSNRNNITGEMVQHTILSRVAEKLSGLHMSTTGHEMNTSEQVDLLIRTANDPNMYTRHFLGWCPFW